MKNPYLCFSGSSAAGDLLAAGEGIKLNMILQDHEQKIKADITLPKCCTQKQGLHKFLHARVREIVLDNDIESGVKTVEQPAPLHSSSATAQL